MAARNKFDVDELLGQEFNLKMIKRSMVYISRERGRFILAIFLQTSAMLLSLCEPLLIAQALDVAVPQRNVTRLLACAALLVCCMAASILLTTQASKVIHVIGQTIILDLRKDLYEHLQQLSFHYYDTRPHGKILVRIINYINSVSNMLSNGLINLFLQLLNLIFIAVFMFSMSVQLSLVILSGLPFTLIIILVLKPIQRKSWQSYSNKSSNMNAYLNESISCMKITQLFTREAYNTGIYSDLIDEAKKSWHKAIVSINAVAPSIDLISKCVTAAMIFLGVFAFKPMISFGVLLGMMQYCTRFWQPITHLANIYNDFMNNLAYLERIFEVIDEPVEVKDDPDAVELAAMEGNVEFCNVSFEYEPGACVLDDVSFTVKAGESIALVGPTGAGKSTIINLISRLYNVTKGKILIDGQDISKVTLHSLRSQLGIMMQDSFIFSTTVAENIRYGNLDADMQQIVEASHTVCADVFIEQLPKRYEEKLTERGSRLSQGQKQLLSFARTLIREPKVLILDEATSSIDTQTERQLQMGLNKMLCGRTSFIVAHRLSTIRACDKIFFIQDGKIAEFGNHDDLMLQKGLYYQLYMTQLSG